MKTSEAIGLHPSEIMQKTKGKTTLPVTCDEAMPQKSHAINKWSNKLVEKA